MKNSKVNGSPISQNGRNVNTFSEKVFKGSPIPQNDRFVNPIFEKSFEKFPIPQTLGNVKPFSEKISNFSEANNSGFVKRFSEENFDFSSIAQNSENVNAFSEDEEDISLRVIELLESFLDMLYRCVSIENLMQKEREELQNEKYEYFVYPRHIKGMKLAEVLYVIKRFDERLNFINEMEEIGENIEMELREDIREIINDFSDIIQSMPYGEEIIAMGSDI